MHDKIYQIQLIEKILSYLEGRTSLDELLLLAHFVPTDPKLKHIAVILNDILARTQYGCCYSYSDLEEIFTDILDDLTSTT